MVAPGPVDELVEDLAAEVARHDGVEAFSEQTLLNLRGDRDVRHHPLLVDGELVGYAQRDGDSAELAIRPSRRGRGLGGRLLDAVLAESPTVAVWAHGPHPGAAPLAAGRGLAVVRELLLMTATPTPTPAPSVPDDVVISTFDADRDGDDWVAVNARAFAEHPEQGRMTREDLQARLAEPWFDADGFWLARDASSGTLLGSMWTKVSDAVGEIYVLGIDPAAQGRRLGSLLTAQAMHAFGAAGLQRVELYVEGDNTPAIRTYQRAGYRRERADLQYARA
jgi:mycothiol synthase